jgi:proline iminopeptidase
MLRETFAPVDGAELYCRETGQGQPLVVIHGGPDFDHRYLLPDMDRLADSYRLIYYDQVGRGRSRGKVPLEEIGIERYVADLDGVRRHLGMDSMAVVGHSWGGVVAMHYAVRHPGRVSHLVLMKHRAGQLRRPMLVRRERLARRLKHAEGLAELIAGFERADPDAVAEFYRIEYSTTFKHPAEAARLNLTWTREQILSGRAIENRLMEGPIWKKGFTFLPELRKVRAPTLVIHGDIDFIPLECDTHIVGAIPGARLVVLRDSGHFPYVDAPDPLRAALDDFFEID